MINQRINKPIIWYMENSINPKTPNSTISQKIKISEGMSNLLTCDEVMTRLKMKNKYIRNQWMDDSMNLEISKLRNLRNNKPISQQVNNQEINQSRTTE